MVAPQGRCPGEVGWNIIVREETIGEGNWICEIELGGLRGERG